MYLIDCVTLKSSLKILVEEGLLLQLKSPRERIYIFIDKIVETRLDRMYLIDCVTLKSPLTKKIVRKW